ncbi:MAG: hypothetical protein KDA27_03095 [Candidatus Eisenbacteria bacterium]|uniref:Uncharacterized protein n=1 Tax=Eiseniibacteriota bacterium TaxID=2212470 RepID=A0A956SBS0_UNCEI|nr:hypothetical protein [Candidatus Eisenbacteria bacterium]
MLGNESVPHWFRRTLSLLNSDISTGRPRDSNGLDRARRSAEERRQMARRNAELRRRRGPAELEEIVANWEDLQAQKARSRVRSKSRIW